MAESSVPKEKDLKNEGFKWKPRLVSMGRFIGQCFGYFVLALLGLWAVLAIHWSTIPWGWLRAVLMILWIASAVFCLFFLRGKIGCAAFLILWLAVLLGWKTIEPTHDRNWREEVSVLPKAEIDGDKVKITGVRNFEYRSVTDFTPRFEEREVDLSHLTGVDLFVSYWKLGPVAHTFVSFIFDNAPPLCVSIEARIEKGEVYSPLASCFKQAELIYVVGDERDVVRVRTNFRQEVVYLYHVRTSAGGARTLLLSYLERINHLSKNPEFYHLLSNNCTVNIDRHAHKNGRVRDFDLRLLLNGYVDGLIYSLGLLDRDIPFHELRSRSQISAAAQAIGPDADFSQGIRHGLPIATSKP